MEVKRHHTPPQQRQPQTPDRVHHCNTAGEERGGEGQTSERKRGKNRDEERRGGREGREEKERGVKRREEKEK